MLPFRVLLAVLCVTALLHPCGANAAEAVQGGEEKTTVLEDVVVTGLEVEAPAAAKVPAVVDSTTKVELEKMNVMTTDDVLRYQPSMYVRKLYPGGSIPLSIRGTYPFSARTIVMADGVNLSDYTSSGGVRWSQVAPEEIQRVDLIYGPYSAIYDGHAYGGVALITTDLPDKLELVAKSSYMYQNFKIYNTDYDLEGNTVHLSAGDKFGNVGVFTLFERMENEAQPISFNTVMADNGGAASGNAVTGYATDLDREGNKRYIYGDRGVRTVTDTTYKLNCGVEIDPDTRVDLKWTHWWSEQDIENVNSYLRDAAGNIVYSGVVDIDGLKYTLADNAFYYQESEYEGNVYALAFKREPQDGLRLWANASFNDDFKNLSRTSTEVPAIAQYGDAGKVSDAEKGWYTFDFRSAYQPNEIPTLASHTLTAGYHFDHYFSESENWLTSDWKNDVRTTFSDGSEGKTSTQAFFFQDEWDVTDKVMLYLGGRYEWWEGFDGNTSKLVGGTRVTKYLPDRQEEHFSPKFAISYSPTQDWGFRLSLARAYRFPSINELFYASISSTGVLNKTNPDLKSEKIFAKDFTVTRKLGRFGDLRMSLFENYTEDTIFSQLDINKNETYYQNVDEVRTRGVELQYEKKGLFFDRLDLMCNGAYMKAKILKNPNLPASEGKFFPRVPEWTAKAVVSYSPIDDLSLTLAGRYASKAYYTLDNVDEYECYGGISEYFFLDAKVSYEICDQLTFSVALDNLNDELAFMGHPYAERIVVATLEWNY